MGPTAVSRFLYTANIANKIRKSSESLAKGNIAGCLVFCSSMCVLLMGGELRDILKPRCL